MRLPGAILQRVDKDVDKVVDKAVNLTSSHRSRYKDRHLPSIAIGMSLGSLMGLGVDGWAGLLSSLGSHFATLSDLVGQVGA